MPVSHEHLKATVQTWDGLTYNMMPTKEAEKLEREGLIQITTNLSASQLKHAAEFNAAREARAAKALEAELNEPAKSAPRRAAKKTYNTRQMKSKD